jgi:hypothetical protein
MIKSTKAFLLAGASALAILASAAEANAETFVFTGGVQTFTASVSGEYAVELLGASGGNSMAFGSVGGLGAEVSGDVFLTAGEDLTLFVGGQGRSATSGGGGGGSFVFNGADVLAVAGGGGGALVLDGGPGLAGKSGGTGGRSGGGTGMDGTGGGGGAANGGGGGAGVKAGSSGYGGDSQFLSGGLGGKFPNGGAAGGSGGFGGGGGGGGGSYLSKLFTDPVLTTGGASRGDGSISISLLTAAVPEPSTWAMTLMGFGGLG